MKRELEKEDFFRLARILQSSWSDLFLILKGSYVDCGGERYVDLFKDELYDLGLHLPNLINDYLYNNIVFDRESLKNWLFQNIIDKFLGCCETTRFQTCVNWLYSKISLVIDPYFKELLPEKEDGCYVIETILSLVGEAIVGHESRILKIDSWDNYCKMFAEYNGTMANYYPSITELSGPSIPMDAEIQSVFHDNQRLRCKMKLKNGWIEKVLAYRCDMIQM